MSIVRQDSVVEHMLEVQVLVGQGVQGVQEVLVVREHQRFQGDLVLLVLQQVLGHRDIRLARRLVVLLVVVVLDRQGSMVGWILVGLYHNN